jgi:hypothetical protein
LCAQYAAVFHWVVELDTERLIVERGVGEENRNSLLFRMSSHMALHVQFSSVHSNLINSIQRDSDNRNVETSTSPDSHWISSHAAIPSYMHTRMLRLLHETPSRCPIYRIQYLQIFTHCNRLLTMTIQIGPLP